MKTNREKHRRVLDGLAAIFRRYQRREDSAADTEIIEKTSPIINKGSHRRMSAPATERHTAELYERIAERMGWQPEQHRLPARRIIPFRPLKKPLRYAAAVAAVVLLAGAAYLFVAPRGEFGTGARGQWAQQITLQSDDARGVTTQTLPDGTVVHLNYATTLTYNPADFNRNKREVTLTGEAFFEVAKNPKKPFLIHHSDMVVRVTGTAFTVTAYEQMQTSTVWVKNGSVEVNQANRRLGTLTQDRKLTYNRTTQTHTQATESWSAGADWMDGKLVFVNAAADEFCLRIKQYYGVELTVDKPAAEALKNINGTFLKTDNPQDVIEAIAQICNLKYNRKGRLTVGH